jgi:hypothetical protein
LPAAEVRKGLRVCEWLAAEARTLSIGFGFTAAEARRDSRGCGFVAAEVKEGLCYEANGDTLSLLVSGHFRLVRLISSLSAAIFFLSAPAG